MSKKPEIEPECSDFQGQTSKRARIEAPRYDFTRGISLQGLRHLASTSSDQSFTEIWSRQWIHETVASGWTVEINFDRYGRWNYQNQTYTHIDSGKKIIRTPQQLESPPGCRSLLDVRADLAPFLSTPTHFLSHPWDMSLTEVVHAVERQAPKGIFWVSSLADNYHDNQFVDSATLRELREKMHPLHVVQVSSSWNDPERFRRPLILFEVCCAVINEQKLTFALPESQQIALAEFVRVKGPDAVLEMTYGFDINTAMHQMITSGLRTQVLLSAVSDLVQQVGGEAEMNMRLAELTRRAFAESVSALFERSWRNLYDSGCSLSSGGYGGSDEMIEAKRWKVLDLGHQLARLWVLTGDFGRGAQNAEATTCGR